MKDVFLLHDVFDLSRAEIRVLLERLILRRCEVVRDLFSIRSLA